MEGFVLFDNITLGQFITGLVCYVGAPLLVWFRFKVND